MLDEQFERKRRKFLASSLQNRYRFQFDALHAANQRQDSANLAAQREAFWQLQDQLQHECDHELDLFVHKIDQNRFSDGSDTDDRGYYSLLGINKEQADAQAISNAFRQRSKQYHPDVAQRIYSKLAAKRNAQQDSSSAAAEASAQARTLPPSDMPQIRDIPNERLADFFAQRQTELNEAKELLEKPAERLFYDVLGSEGLKYARKYASATTHDSKAQQQGSSQTSSSQEQLQDLEQELERLKLIVRYKNNSQLDGTWTARLNAERIDVELAQVRLAQLQEALKTKLVEASQHKSQIEKNVAEKQQEWEKLEQQAMQVAAKYGGADKVEEALNASQLTEQEEALLVRMAKLEDEYEEDQQSLAQLKNTMKTAILGLKKTQRLQQNLQKGSRIVRLQDFKSQQIVNIPIARRVATGFNSDVSPFAKTFALSAFVLWHPFTSRSGNGLDDSCVVANQWYHVQNLEKNVSKLIYINKTSFSVSPQDQLSINTNVSCMTLQEEAGSGELTQSWGFTPEKIGVEWQRELVPNQLTATVSTDVSTSLRPFPDGSVEASLDLDASVQVDQVLTDDYSQSFGVGVVDQKLDLSYAFNSKWDRNSSLQTSVECSYDPSHLLAGAAVPADLSSLGDVSLALRYSRKIPSKADELLLGNRPIIYSQDGSAFAGGIMVPPPQSVSLGASLSTNNGISLLLGYKRGSMQFQVPVSLSKKLLDWRALLALVAVPLLGYSLVYKPIKNVLERRNLLAMRKANWEATKSKRDRTYDYWNRKDIIQKYNDIISFEEGRKGLIITHAEYGNLEEMDDMEKQMKKNLAEDDEETRSRRKTGVYNHKDYHPPYIDVTRDLQLLVEDSKLIIDELQQNEKAAGYGKWWQLASSNVYDPCPGEPKQLRVTYNFKGKIHRTTVDDQEKLEIPKKTHAQEDEA